MSGYSVRAGLLLCLMFIVTEGYAGMFGLGKRVDVFLCPEVRGQITMNGEPLSGVRVMREVVYDDGFVDETESSPEGQFSFAKLMTRSRTPTKAFDETRTVQAITAEFDGQRYLLWAYATDSIVEEALISEKLANLECDLANEEKYHHFPRPDSAHLTYNIKGVCRWSE